jgi:hypothetical protein
LQVASQIPTLCEVGRKEERETLDGKVGEEPLPYSIDINMIIKKKLLKEILQIHFIQLCSLFLSRFFISSSSLQMVFM